jgi:exosome complex exonuclease RRP6
MLTLSSGPSSARATTSMLDAGLSTKPSVLFAAPRSTLLGSMFGPQRKAHVARPTFDAVVAKIHSSLSVAPTVPQVRHGGSPISRTMLIISQLPTPPPESSGDAPANAQEATVDENGQIEIPFVPAEQRQSTNLEMEGGIVVVGQRQKKRKRDRTAKKAATTPPEPEAEVEAEIEPYDYASAPNVLDEGARLLEDPAAAGKKRKLGKHEGRGAVFQYGDFPMPPRNPTDVRSGNRSQTFR